MTSPEATGGQFWGPRYLTKGAPALHTPTRTSTDPEVGAQFWSFAEQATDSVFTVGG